MKLALCDDEMSCLIKLSSYLKEYFLKYPQLKITISRFSHGEELLEDIYKNGEYDLYFLDILMPGMNGISLGLELRSHGFTGSIIYLTSSPEFAIDSYRVRAYDYLLKPLNSSALFSTLDVLLPSLIHKKENFTIVKTKESSVKILLEQIMYAQLSNRIIHYHLRNGTIVRSLYLRSSFTEAVSDLLTDPSFLLCGAGMVVNLSTITRIENGNAVFFDNYIVPLGTTSFRTLKVAWVDYCINKENL